MPRKCFDNLSACGYRDGRFLKSLNDGSFLIEMVEFQSKILVFRFHDISEERTYIYIVRCYSSSLVLNVIDSIVNLHRKSSKKFVTKGSREFYSFSELPDLVRNFQIEVGEGDRHVCMEEWEFSANVDRRHRAKVRMLGCNNRDNDKAVALFMTHYIDVWNDCVIFSMEDDYHLIQCLEEDHYEEDPEMWIESRNYVRDFKSVINEVSQIFTQNYSTISEFNADVNEIYETRVPFRFFYHCLYDELCPKDRDGYRDYSPRFPWMKCGMTSLQSSSSFYVCDQY